MVHRTNCIHYKRHEAAAAAKRKERFEALRHQRTEALDLVRWEVDRKRKLVRSPQYLRLLIHINTILSTRKHKKLKMYKWVQWPVHHTMICLNHTLSNNCRHLQFDCRHLRLSPFLQAQEDPNAHTVYLPDTTIYNLLFLHHFLLQQAYHRSHQAPMHSLMSFCMCMIGCIPIAIRSTFYENTLIVPHTTRTLFCQKMTFRTIPVNVHPILLNRLHHPFTLLRGHSRICLSIC